MRWLNNGVVLCAALMPRSAEAVQLIGPGGMSCGTLMSDEKSHPVIGQMDLAWILGFLTGVGYENGSNLDPLRDVDGNGVAAWIDSYCSAHPLERMVDAAEAFIRVHPR